MERPRPVSPPGPGAARRIGPYHLITRLDPVGTGLPAVPERRFIARGPNGDRTVLLSTPHPTTDPARFAVEAWAARHLMGPWVSQVTEVSEPADSPWYATSYLPLLPLPVVLAVHGGPLPEATVRAVGAALAETLATAHSLGVTHAGVSPAAVLLAGDGPRLGCFGAVRVAAADGEARAGLPGLDPGSLAPEQASGGRPRPPGDVYALGAVLAYAATGHTVPERDELPSALRSLISSCLVRDPAQRPSAADILTELVPVSASPHGTVLHSTNTRAASLLTPGWLPGRVIAALARQSAAVLAADITPFQD